MIKTLVIGLGKVSLSINKKNALNLNSHCGLLAKNKNFKIVGGVDKKIKQIKIFRSFFDCKCFTKIKMAMIKTQPNLVVIATPTNTHLKIIKEVIFNRSKNLKVILLEKPAGSGLHQIKHIKNLFRNKRIKVFVNYSRDYEKAFSKLSIFFLKSSFCNAEVSYHGGFINNASHFISLFVNFFGKIKYVITLKKKKIKKDFLIKCIIYFKNCRLVIKNNNKKKISSFYIEYGNNHLLSYYNKNGSILRGKKKFLKKIKNNLNKGHFNTYNQIKNFFSKKKYYICSLNKAYYIHKIINRCINS
jgi:predicted dehydrogenase